MGLEADWGRGARRRPAEPLDLAVAAPIAAAGGQQCPLGQIELKHETYRNGRSAAALIVRGMHDAYWQSERDRVERVA